MTQAAVQFDPHLAGSHRSMAEHLTAPLSAGAVLSEIPIGTDGRLVVDFAPRHPMLLLGLRTTLGNETIRALGTLGPGAPAELVPLVFWPWSQRGTALPLHSPLVGATDGFATPFEVQLSAERVAGVAASKVEPAEIAGLFEATLVEGVMGKVLYALGAEKGRIRRVAVELGRQRGLADARDDALDRHGADLGVPRFSTAISYDEGTGQAILRTLTDAQGRPTLEPDDRYRRRLALYRPMHAATPRRVSHMLNGDAAPGDPPNGMIAHLGVGHRFTIREDDNPFAVAVTLVQRGPGDARDRFLRYVRAVHLEWPEDSAEARAIYAARARPTQQVALEDERRRVLRSRLTLPPRAAMATGLATCLARLVRCMARLERSPSPIRVLRLQDDAGGSRFELGLGAAIEPLAPETLNRMRAALERRRTEGADRDPETSAILAGIDPRAVPSAEADPEGSWLLRACGFRTVHRLSTSQILVSHMPIMGLAVDVGAALPGGAIPLEARYHAPGDPGRHAVLEGAITRASGMWRDADGESFRRVADADAITLWRRAIAVGSTHQARAVLMAAGLPAVSAPADIAARLSRLPAELHETILLPGGVSGRLARGETAGATELGSCVAQLRAGGVASVLPLLTPQGVALVVGAIGLPEAGTNTAASRSAGFRWYSVPLSGPAASVTAVGSRALVQGSSPGLSAVLTVGYARVGSTDPYEFRVELPPESQLDIEAYEYLMNLLERACPMGVEVNTFHVRQSHLAFASALPGLVSPSLASAFRRFRSTRFVG